MLLEICANSLQSALIAQEAGAGRIELCQNLEQGGITPSYGLICVVKQRLSIPVFVLIRPRPGNFDSGRDGDDGEMEIMLRDIQMCRDLGIHGVVLGVLTTTSAPTKDDIQDKDKKYKVDTQRTRRLVEAARPMKVTFHRAFDDCHDMFAGLEDVIETGCDRILTSGGCRSAVDEMTTIGRLVVQARGRIVIMPGSGINAQNLENVVEVTNAVEFHTSATKKRIAKKSVDDGTAKSLFDVELLETDAESVRQMVGILERYRGVAT